MNSDDIFCLRWKGLESDSEVELGLFILRSGPWAKSYHLIPTTSLLNRNPSPLPILRE